MGNTIQNVKLMYASAPRNLQITIPLIQQGSYDTADIKSRLKAAGVTDEELPFVIFSPVEFPDQRNMPKDFPLIVNPNQPPPFPTPSGPGVSPPLDSVFGDLTSVKVSKNWRQLTGRSYCMSRADGQGYVSMLDLPPANFVNKDDYSIIQDGKLELCFGLRWRLNTPQFIADGGSWNNVIRSKHGMSTTTTYSISATVGYAADGISAALSATFGQTFVVSSETEVTTTVNVQPIAGMSQTATEWDLLRCYVVKVNGVIRDSSNPFTVLYTDKKGQHTLRDTWTGQYDTISNQPTLRIWSWKD